MRHLEIHKEMLVEIVVGAFVLLVLAGLGYFTIILSRENWFQQKIMFEVVFENVNGLRDGDHVALRGMTIGKVQRLRLLHNRVGVIAALDQPVELRRDYTVRVAETSILGGRQLVIDEGTPGSPRLPEGETVVGLPPRELLDEASAIVHRLREALEEGGILENLRETAAELRRITERLGRGEGTLGRLLAEDGVYEDVRAIAANLKDLSDQLARGEGTLGGLLRDRGLYDDLNEIAGNLKAISRRLAEGRGTLGRLLSEDDTLYRDMAAAAASLRTVAARVERGEGALGKLLQDDGLYQDVESAVGEVRRAIEDFRESTPVTTFSSLLFGAF